MGEICEMIIMRFYAPVFILRMLAVSFLVWCFIVAAATAVCISFFIFFFRFIFVLGSSGELVLIYLFLTFAIYIEQTTAHSKKTAVSCSIEL